MMNKNSSLNTEKFQRYSTKILAVLMDLANSAKTEADNPNNDFERFLQGVLMGYYSIISLLKHQALVFGIDQQKIGFADINPDIDILGLRINPDIVSSDDDWTIYPINEETIKGYLSDSIVLLKEQAKSAKIAADNPEEGPASFNKGELKAYYTAISILKHEALLLDIKQEDIELADIEPECDLI